MKVPLSWLKEYVDIIDSLDVLLERLTLAGLEVASVQRIGDWWDRERLVVGEVLEVRPHPNADRLVLADVAYGGPEVEQVVTGAPNLFPYKGAGPVSLKVAFAMEGAELYDGHKEGFVKTRLKGTKIRGVPSRAMVCSEKELGISEEHEGIMFLPAGAPVGTPLADYLGDTIVDLDLTPNLARCFNMVGVAREVAALTGARLRYPSTEWQADGPPATELARVEIEDPQLCARYIATIIRDVEIGPAPQWMQSRVQKAGMRPISNVVDVTNYVMLEWGQPLHAFDYDKLVARAGGNVPTIIVRRARPGETMTTLDGVHRAFTEDTLLICDTAGPVAVAGVMGGLDTEVDENTRNVLLESANFYFISIRRTMQAMKLPSEASQRFGRGIHPAVAEPAVRRASELMRLLAGGTIAQGMVDNYPLPPRPAVIDLTAGEVERQLGIRFGLEEIRAYLERLEFVCEPLDGQTLRVVAPDHRLDCQLPADLVEEVARIYGYDRIPVTDLADRLPPQRSNPALEREEAVRDALVGCGLQEIITYSLTNLRQEAALRPGTRPEDLPAETYVTLANPISQDRALMRHTLLANALETAAANLRFRDRVQFFEVGKVFLLRPGWELPEEMLRLSLVVSGARQDRHWLAAEAGEAEVLDFFDLKGIVEALLERLHVEGAAFEPAEHPTFQPGRTARLVLPGPAGVEAVEIGVLGELHPAVREAFDLPPWRVAAAELDLDALLARVPDTWRVEPISPYPAILQDLAVVVDEEVPAAAVEAAIVEAGGFLLRDVQLFDVYRGVPVPAGKKSLAYALTFQAPDKTLRDEIVARQVKGIVRKLEQELGAEMRA
ncbi:MAG TPA: phenylalanine--tRNA ligase subunit beta [Anaerolineae bacterium]|nr:phenylalanine--tRNA ligase subunit beta [Anaerolineae bacterium]